jgi:hypothetical protein
MPRMNPYAPPQVQSRPKLPHGQMKYFFLGLCLFPILFAVLILVSRDIVPLIAFAGLAGWTGAGIAWLLWVYRTWGLLSHEARGGMAPATAILLCLVPVYSIYWTFVLHHRIAMAMHQTLAKLRTRKTSPLTLAWVAPGAPVVLALFFLLVLVSAPASPEGFVVHFRLVTPIFFALELSIPILAFAFMARVDGGQVEILFQRAERKARRASAKRIREWAGD